MLEMFPIDARQISEPSREEGCPLYTVQVQGVYTGTVFSDGS